LSSIITKHPAATDIAPRDLLLQIRNFCLFHEQQPTMSNEAVDAARTNYFSIMSC
jgi:hypothetical protein